ncbi:CRISPR-associated helicase Cas3' [Atopobiaceae bacterium HCP3S3_A4]
MSSERHVDDSGYIAHIREDGAEEEVAVHLSEVAKMASGFGGSFDAAESARAIGCLHDIGKYSQEFQRRIRDEGPKVDHSTAGAFELAKKNMWWLSYCVAGHHGGLLDGESPYTDSTQRDRLRKAAAGKIPTYRNEASEKVLDSCIDTEKCIQEFEKKTKTFYAAGQQASAFSASFFIRMCFSCLVDADFLCTESFMQGESREPVPTEGLDVIARRYEERISAFYPPKTALDALRCAVSDECASAGRNLQPGLFTLTVPTGGGKTLAVMRFALQHACKFGMGRIIVAEPFTSIIEQNAEKYRQYLDGEDTENVLEHHSNFDFDAFDEDPLRKNLRLASENWDMPIVVTTNVRLFESLFAARTSRCRKLHNIANSVIVLDEAQAIPLDEMKACVRALSELIANYNCSVVLCTATQPALDMLFQNYGIKAHEIAANRDELFEKLRRVSYENVGRLSDQELADRLCRHDQVLCIVNSRAQARNVAIALKGLCESESIYHLSTLMYPAHREQVLEAIVERLKNELPCRVVSTSLIEAGVDLDFPTVYRAMAGLDSIVQAAGRCNRENRHPYSESMVYLFEPVGNPETGRRYRIPAITEKNKGIAEIAVPELQVVGQRSDFGSLQYIRRYFRNLMALSLKLDKNKTEKVLNDLGIATVFKVRLGMGGEMMCPSISFRTAEEEFKFIDDSSTPVAIPDKAIAEEIKRVECGVATRNDIRRIGRYSVPIYEQTLKDMLNAGKVERIEQLYVLTDLRWYTEDFGLDCSNVQGEGMFW